MSMDYLIHSICLFIKLLGMVNYHQIHSMTSFEGNHNQDIDISSGTNPIELFLSSDRETRLNIPIVLEEFSC